MSGRARAYRALVSRDGSLRERVSDWLVPDVNPAGVVYGVLAIGTLIAAEGARRETYGDVTAASLLALFLYWLAHTYAHHFASRLEDEQGVGLRPILTDLLHEGALLEGAALPIVAVLLCWLVRAPLSSGVNAALWTAGVELFGLELASALRRQLHSWELAVEVVIGALLGAGVLLVHVLLH